MPKLVYNLQLQFTVNEVGGKNVSSSFFLKIIYFNHSHFHFQTSSVRTTQLGNHHVTTLTSFA